MVSVPWVTTAPATPGSDRTSSTFRLSLAQIRGVMWEESMLPNWWTLIRASPEMPGTAPTRSLPETAGTRAPVFGSSFSAMVPPVVITATSGFSAAKASGSKPNTNRQTARASLYLMVRSQRERFGCCLSAGPGWGREAFPLSPGLLAGTRRLGVFPPPGGRETQGPGRKPARPGNRAMETTPGISAETGSLVLVRRRRALCPRAASFHAAGRGRARRAAWLPEHGLRPGKPRRAVPPRPGPAFRISRR